MLNLLKESFIILKGNTLLTLPFILYLFLLTLTTSGMFLAKTNIMFLAFFVTILVMSASFLSGWFFMTRKIIWNSKRYYENKIEKEIDSLKTLKEFFIGVGEYILPVLGSIILYILFLLAFTYIIYKIGIFTIGTPKFTIQELKSAVETVESMNNYVNTMPIEKAVSITSWGSLLIGTYFFYSFLTMFWYADLFFNTKNPLVAFLSSVGFTFRHFFLNVGLFIYLNIISTLISFFNSAFSNNIILGTIGLLLLAYFTSYWAILIFLTYYEKTDNRNNRPDSIG